MQPKEFNRKAENRANNDLCIVQPTGHDTWHGGKAVLRLPGRAHVCGDEITAEFKQYT